MAAKKEINVGIVGLGFMAATHIKAYRAIPEARIYAVCNPSGRCLDGDLTKVGGNINANDPVRLDMTQVKGTREFNDLLNDPEIDLIDICTPTLQHPEMFAAALRAGKHVICEKPLARDSKSAGEMAAAMIAPALPFVALKVGDVITGPVAGSYMGASMVAMIALIVYRRREYQRAAAARA